MTLPEHAPNPTSPHPATASHQAHPVGSRMPQAWVWTSLALGIAATIAIISAAMLWQRLNNIQQQLALQSADSRGQAVEARTLARQAEDVSRDTASRMSVMEARVGEVALQRGQLEELVQSLSRNRDDTMVGDIESAVRFAMQQSQLSGSPDPLVSALKIAQQRVTVSAQPRLAPLQRAIARDLDRIAASKSLDTAGLLARMDDLLRQIDDLPLQNDVLDKNARRTAPARNRGNQSAAPAAASAPAEAATDDSASPSWWLSALSTAWGVVHEEARSLVRVRRIDYPDAVLLSPTQAFFVRENLKLRILNARMALLGRQMNASRNDLAAAADAVHKYFDISSRRGQQAAQQLNQLQQAMQDVEVPRANDTLAALATAAAGR
ncbi:uroporphyrinogen-III C-methyltransferase [Comamonas sp. B-9]|uniref:uroporphyrinogen-III C-methyltransferase n=1 Tax=Comamonas sp. B-9 TaxID=1055192 RepID=UPI000395DE05|nr:uroporphyrinogen-III C-methyltransferase [Comamonas sp. B-9]